MKGNLSNRVSRMKNKVYRTGTGLLAIIVSMMALVFPAEAVTAASDDLVLNEPVTTSGAILTYEAAKAVDGEPNSRWMANAATGRIRVDLGSEQSFNRWQLSSLNSPSSEYFLNEP